MSTCPNIPEIDYREFSEQLFEEIMQTRIPIVGGIELTFRCNLRCLHCYVPDNERKIEKEMHIKHILRIMDEMADEGCLWLLFTGGDPLIREDFLEIYTYAKKKGLLITVFTNGSLFTEKIINCFKNLPPYLIEITLYGMTERTYNHVTRTNGKWTKALQGIKSVVEAGLPLKLKTVAMKSNKHEILDIKRFAESLGVPFQFDSTINPGLDGSTSPCNERLAPEEVIELDLMDLNRPAEWKKFSENYQRKPEDPTSLYYCGAGINCFNIDYRGRLALCLLAREPNYDLISGNFKEGWRDFLLKARTEKVPPGKCSTCDKVSLCGYCPGWAQLERRNPKEPFDYLCQIAHLREKFLLAPLKGGETDGAETKTGLQKAWADSSKHKSYRQTIRGLNSQVRHFRHV